MRGESGGVRGCVSVVHSVVSQCGVIVWCHSGHEKKER